MRGGVWRKRVNQLMRDFLKKEERTNFTEILLLINEMSDQRKELQLVLITTRVYCISPTGG